ncbi:MAG: acyl-CoA dehydrogenase family protein [Rudaea sp.]
MPFVQAAPQLGNQYQDDAVLRAWLRRAFDARSLAAIESDLMTLGGNAADAWRSSRERPPEQPQLTAWDAWGNRIDRIDLTRAWRTAQPIAARFGLVAAGHEPALGALARPHQFALVYLFHCASEFYTCPLAMSDGAVTAIRASGNVELIARVLPRLLSRDPAQHWICGQWMTETRGGSDVSQSETVALKVDGEWRLYGRKWFTSAINAQMALALARPENGADGADGLALFQVEPRDEKGRWQGVKVDRLKHKLGTRELPTAEIHLDGVRARLVGAAEHGVRAIAPMLNVTRTWNAVCALATMRRALALAHDFALRRSAFGRPLAEQPLHRATLADLDARFQAAFHLVFHVVELLGRVERGAADAAQHDQLQRDQLRLLTPLIKLWTGKLAVAIVSEACECLGGAGYLEDSGMPQLLRDAQVFPIWEGTTNVLALDFLRALGRCGGADTLIVATDEALSSVTDGALAECARVARASCAEAATRLAGVDRDGQEAQGRRIALGFAEGVALALLARHAQWAMQHGDESRSADAARRFATLVSASCW